MYNSKRGVNISTTLDCADNYFYRNFICKNNNLIPSFSQQVNDLGIYTSWIENIFDYTGDYDDDGLTNENEVAIGTSPFTSDTDNDGIDDGLELNLGIDPCNDDTDGDGYLDGVEVALGTDPRSATSYPGSTVTAPTDFTDIYIIILLIAVGAAIILNVILLVRTRNLKKEINELKIKTKVPQKPEKQA